MPAAATLEEIRYDDPRLGASFDDSSFDGIEFRGSLSPDNDWPMDFIYPPDARYAAGSDVLAAVAAAARLATGSNAGVTAVLQGRDGACYVTRGLSAGFSGDGGGDWELASGDLETVSVDSPHVVAVVDADGWFDLRAHG